MTKEKTIWPEWKKKDSKRRGKSYRRIWHQASLLDLQ